MIVGSKIKILKRLKLFLLSKLHQMIDRFNEMKINLISSEVICNHTPHTNHYIHNLHSKYFNMAYIELITNNAFQFAKKNNK